MHDNDVLSGAHTVLPAVFIHVGLSTNEKRTSIPAVAGLQATHLRTWKGRKAEMSYDTIR